MNTHSPSPPVSPPLLFALLAGQREPRAGTSDDFDDVCETAIGFHTSLYLFCRALCVNLYLGCPVGIRRIYVRHAFSSLTEEPCHLLDRRCFALRNFVSMRNAYRHNCAKCRAVMATRGTWSFLSFSSFFSRAFLEPSRPLSRIQRDRHDPAPSRLTSTAHDPDGPRSRRLLRDDGVAQPARHSPCTPEPACCVTSRRPRKIGRDARKLLSTIASRSRLVAISRVSWLRSNNENTKLDVQSFV